MNRQRQRLVDLERQQPSDCNREVVQILQARLEDPTLSDHRRDVIRAILAQGGIIAFSQRHDAEALGIGPDIEPLYRTDTPPSTALEG